MPQQPNNVHQQIISEIKQSLEVSSSKIDDDVKNTKTSISGHTLRTDINSFKRLIRDRWDNALSKFISDKTTLPATITSHLKTETKVDQIEELNKMTGLARAETAKKNKALDQIKELEVEIATEPYKKFIKYKDLRKTKKKNETALFEPLHKKYLSQKKKRLLIGIFATLLCAATDFFMINTLFLIGNLSVRDSLISAFFAALTLDVPPYLLGMAIARRDDNANLNELKNEPTNAADRDARRNRLTIRILLPLIILILLIYIMIRVFAFLGNGDFSDAFTSVLSGTFEFSQRSFNASDLLSALVPFATSIASFVIGMFLFSPEATFIQDMNIAIDDDLANKIAEKKDEIHNYDETLDNINNRRQVLMLEIWAFYMGSKPFASNENEFIISIVNAFRSLDLFVYMQTYKTCTRLILQNAKAKLNEIKTELAPYCNDEMKIRQMDVTEARLNEIWVECAAPDIVKPDELYMLEMNAQHITTQNQMREIQETMTKIEQMLTNITPDYPKKGT